MPKPAPIDTAAIARATRFDVTIFLGTGRYHTEHCHTLAAARERAPQITAETANGRKAMIYAVAEGRSVFVPESYQPSNEGEHIMDTNLSAIQIAQLSAIITGGGAKRSNSKEAAVKRFQTIAAEKGLTEGQIKTVLTAADPKIVLDSFLAFIGAEAAAEPEPAKIELTAKDHAKIADAAKAVATEIVRRRDKRNAAIAAMNHAPDANNGDRPNPARDEAAAAKPAKSRRGAALEAAQRGELPAAPDFSAATHRRFRPRLAKLVEMAQRGDVAGLKAEQINPVSSSPKAMARFRDLAVAALEARKATAA